MKYIKIIRDLREDHDMTQRDVADYLGTSQTMYARYECMCLCVYMCVHVCVSVYAHVCLCVSVCACECVCACVCDYVCMCVSV